MRTGWRVMVGLSGLGAILAPARTARGAQAPPPAGVLRVPYLAQSTLLCGGAAVAMVERWWGRHGVFAEEFASLVRRDEGGIRTTDLVTAVRERGWRARPFQGSADLVRGSLADSIPVIALIEVSRDRYHYVVITGWSDDAVTYHDPAIAPNATLAPSAFSARWRAADDWALVILPRVDPIPDSAAARPPLSTGLPCPPWLDRAATAAAAGDLDGAAEALEQAARACPHQPLVRREQAGLAFRNGDRGRAGRLAAEYLRVVPTDTLAWQLLATVRYLDGDRQGALEAWNRIGRPTVDLLRITGRNGVRFRAITEATAIPLGELLTHATLALGRRRLDDIPALGTTRLDYRPIPGGMVELEAAVVERPRWPTPPRLVLATGRAVAGGVAEIALGSLTGAGERWDARWRWRSANPEVALTLAVPYRIGIPGVVKVTGSHEEWRFEGEAVRQRRRSATIGVQQWWTGGIETRAMVRHERWNHRSDAVVMGAGVGLHGWQDRLALVVEGEQATAFDDHPSYRRASAVAHWQSTRDPFRTIHAARVGITWTSDRTPPGLQPVAGGDAGRAVPLRAHRWDRDDRLSLERIGRGMLHGGVSIDRDLVLAGPFVVGAGGFVDVADVMDRGTGGWTDQWYVDAGVGVRIGLPGSGGTLRFDLARGLAAESRWGVSVGLAQSWPPRADGID